ncbi:hypothetical protein NDU88_002153 [Pleurodeles waltl]|uniref:Uncharacterized protein n=1 Tax=Pleurodeles waltl TaxID=8319 RepID=A0AAV7P948_PLEWA|nr:hypothetical protein NDU88_002153 [Pleurodeles waltl]
MAAVPVEAGGTDVAATPRELPSEDVSLSLLSPAVPVVVLPSPSGSLVPSVSVPGPTGALCPAAPSCSDAKSPPPDDANAHMHKKMKRKGGGRKKKTRLSACNVNTVGGEDRHRCLMH